mmetsp:Transcript_21485/g.48407  ORF Transcript_21485/g.48407 Transcript_21485/m.48407 type:complete len:89 (+) Transcript_21485:61-327(+)
MFGSARREWHTPLNPVMRRSAEAQRVERDAMRIWQPQLVLEARATKYSLTHVSPALSSVAVFCPRQSSAEDLSGAMSLLTPVRSRAHR